MVRKIVPMDKAQSGDPFTHFVWREQWPEMRIYTSSWVEGIQSDRLVRGLKEKD